MAYFVLAVGAVMALLGALAIITGYPIIQIERGWATVIAGATLLAGGVVTMTLGLLLRALVDMRATLANAVFAPPVRAATDIYAEPDLETTFSGAQEHAPDEAKSHYGDIALGATAVALPIAAVAASTRHAPEAGPHNAEDEPSDPAPVIEPIGHHAEPPIPEPHEPSHSPPMDDWLDKAFANLALEATPTTPEAGHGPSTQVEPEPLHPEHVAALHDGEILYADEHDTAHAEHHAEAAHEVAHHETEHDVQVGFDEPAHVEPVGQPASAPHSAESSGPAVIGRYEAEGTFYTMFADGSIEAQSDAGIYRFASMAELKAFIEG